MIALDSNIFIYMLEGNPRFGRMSQDLFLAVEQTRLDACASELVLFEVLAHSALTPTQIRQTRGTLQKLGIDFELITENVLLKAAQLRRKHGLGALDAIHVAAAIVAKAGYFVSNDQRLLKKKLPEITLLSLAHVRDVILT